MVVWNLSPKWLHNQTVLILKLSNWFRNWNTNFISSVSGILFSSSARRRLPGSAPPSPTSANHRLNLPPQDLILPGTKRATLCCLIGAVRVLVRGRFYFPYFKLAPSLPVWWEVDRWSVVCAHAWANAHLALQRCYTTGVESTGPGATSDPRDN